MLSMESDILIKLQRCSQYIIMRIKWRYSAGYIELLHYCSYTYTHKQTPTNTRTHKHKHTHTHTHTQTQTNF